MPIQEPQGLPGLRGWGQLSQEERDAFKAAHPKMGGLTWKQQKSAYANQQFIDRFGRDQFNRLSRQERDAMMRSAVVSDTIDNTFKDDDRYEEIKGLSTESQMELLNSDYKKNADRLQELNEWDEKHGDTFRAVTLAAGQVGMDIAKGRARNKATSIFNDIQNRDSKRKAEDTSGDKSAIAGQIVNGINTGSLSVDEFNKQFDSLFKGGSTVVSSSLGDITVENPGISHYKAFENAHELQDYGLEDKIQDYSEYLAIQGRYGTAAAQRALENKLQERVTANQNVWDWVGSAAYGAGTKAAANIANKVVGLSALTMAGDKDRLANYLEGKDENGEDLVWWRSPKYWNGADQYASLDPNYIAKVQNEYGGVSKYTLQTNPGEERTFSVAMNEAFKMAGYMASDALVNYALGGAANGLTKLAGGSFVAGELATGAPALAQFINNNAPFAIGAINATGISESYGIQAYEQTLQEANDRISAKRFQDADNYVQSVLGSESGLVLGRGILEGTTKESNATAGLLNEYVRARTEDILQKNPNLSLRDIDQEALYDEGMQRYAEVLRQRYLNEHDADYEADRKLARDAAASAYMIDASFEEARMAFANVTYRKFLLSDASRKALAKQFSNLRTADKAGTLVSRSASGASPELTKWSPLLKNIWGGTRDNYLDDVTVAFSKGFALAQFNNALDDDLSPQKYAATTNFMSNFLVGMTGGIESARASMTDPQSLFDGFVGGMGGAVTIAPRLGRIARGETQGAYDSKDVYRVASENAAFVDEYGLVDIDKYMKSDAFKADVASGKIRKRSVAERINDYVFNPLLQDYSDAAQRLRDYNYLIDVANKTIADNRPKFDALVRHAAVLNGAAIAQEEGNLANAKDLKAKQAYLLATELKAFSEDPMYSQSEYIQQVQKQLEDFSKGNIDNETIIQFLNQPENKSIKEGANPEAVAKERIQTNAQQLIEMQEAYNKAIEEVKASKQYMTIANTVGAEYVANQLAFNRAMKNNRDKRMSEMETEIRESSQVSETSSPIALYGSEEGRARFEAVQQEYVEGHQKRIEAIEKQISALKRVKDRTGRKRIAIKAKELELAEERRRLSEAREQLKEVKRAQGFDFSQVLSKEDILALNPIERARMLQREKNPAQYTSEQQAVIDALISDLNIKNPALLETIQDSKTLYERNRDLVISNRIMLDNPQAAADYYGYAKAVRDFGVLRVYNRRARDFNDSLLNKFDDTDTIGLYRQAKQFPTEGLEGYVQRFPERAELLKPIIELSKLKSDTDKALRNRFDPNSSEFANYARQIDNIYNADHITTVEEAMSAFEDVIENTEGADRTAMEQVMEDLQALHYQRNATKAAERKAREEEKARIAEEEARRKDGATYGWAGYKVGDTVYHTSKKERFIGTVRGFDEKTGAILVRWGENKTIDKITNKDLISKEPSRSLGAMKEKGKQTTQTEPPTPPAPPVNPPVQPAEQPAAQKQIDNDGSVVQDTPEQEVQKALSTPERTVVKPSTEEPLKLANEYVGDGIMEGNVLYEYESAGLANSEKGQRNATRKPDRGSLRAYYQWEDATDSHIQAIIDDELSHIIDENPNIPVRLMQKNVASGDAMGDVVLEVIEFTPEVAKHHKEANKGVFDANGKKWLVIGTLGYNRRTPEMEAAFYNIKDKLRHERISYFRERPTENYYVSDSYSTRVNYIYSGMITDSYNGDGLGTTRTLGELMNGKNKSTTNPHGITFDNAVFGIMYTRNGLVLFNTNSLVSGKQVFGPRDVETNVGLLFLMVPSSNGNYIPIALEPAKLTDLNEGSDLQTIINRHIDGLAAPELSDRQEALKNLSDYLVFSKGKDEIRVKDNTITILRTGEDGVTHEKILTIDDPALRANLRQEIINVAQFRVNVTPKVLENSSMLEIYDAAGALRTTAAKLGAVNASFNVLMMDDNGRAIERAIPASETPAPAPLRTNDSTFNYIGVDYVVRDSKVYDTNGKEVPYKVAREVRIAHHIISQNLIPEHKTEKGDGEYYRIPRTGREDLIVMKHASGVVQELTDKQAARYNERLAKRRADEAARKAIEESKPLPDEAPGAKSLTIPTQQTTQQVPGSDLEGYVPAEPPAPTPAQQKEETAREKSETPKQGADKGIITKPVTTEENQGKSYNFNTEFRNSESRTYREAASLLTRKGYNPENMSLKQQKEALKKLGISYDTVTNEESFIEMLNNCK